MIGKRLKLARSAAGLSLRGLATNIGSLVTPQAIGKYERNESMPSSGVLTALSGALGVPIDYLLSDRDIFLEDVRFRKKDSASKRERLSVEATVLYRLERYLAIEEILGLTTRAWDAPSEIPYPVWHESGDPERSASSLRMHWKLGLGPIPNLAELLEERGVKVFQLDLSKVHGVAATVRISGGGPTPIIAVNRHDCGHRQRFTLAHELGHAVLQIGPGVDAEAAAHRFAEAFLLPAEALWAVLGKFRESICLAELLHVKQRFGASMQAIAYRCIHLGIFSSPLAKALFDLFKERGWSVPPYKEPIPVPREEAGRFERLCYRALTEGMISDSRAAELLGLPVYVLDGQLAEEASLVQVGSARK